MTNEQQEHGAENGASGLPDGDSPANRSVVVHAKIAGMDCGSCALTIEDGLKQLPGVRYVSVDFTTESLKLEGDVPLSQVEHRLKQLGYALAPNELAANVPELTRLAAASESSGFLRFVLRDGQQRVAVAAAGAALLATFLAYAVGTPASQQTLRWVLAAVVILVGAPIFSKGLRALLFSRRITIDLLMTLAAVGALLIGESGEAATVVLLFTFGEGLERFSAGRTRDSLRSLLSLQPQTATLVRPRSCASACGSDHVALSGPVHEYEQHHRHNDAPDHAHDPHHDHEHDGCAHDDRDASAPHEHRGHTHDHCDASASHEHRDHTHDHHDASAPDEHRDHAHDDRDAGGSHAHRCDSAQHAAASDEHSHQPVQRVVRSEDLSPGDLILVKPGERIPADGTVRNGESSVNEAAVTGESLPITKTAGASVLAGTVNGEGALEVEVTRKAADSTVSRIARLVEQAQAQRSPAERFIDRFARWYTPAVVLFALLLVLIPVLVLGQPLLDGADGSRGWLYRGLALLIVACPCALVISIPVTVVSSLTRLAGLGVLVKGGEQLDKLAEVRTIAFDKTGTLTHGRPSVTAVQARGCAHDAEPTAGPDCPSCDDVIALAASVERGSEHPIARAILRSANERGLAHRYPPARSVVASAGRGVKGELRGSTIAVGTEALMTEQGAAAGLAEFAEINRSKRTVMMVARGASVVGAIGVEDAVRTETRAVLEELRRVRPGLRTVMLTGDNERVAREVAERVGIADPVRAELLPAGKLTAIRELQQRQGPVAMVGDGINDAPALASADVGIAMGGAGTAQAMETADVVLMHDDLHRLPTALRISRRNRSIVKQNIALSLGLKLAFLALAIPGLATLWLAVVADVGATVLVTLNGMRMLRTR